MSAVALDPITCLRLTPDGIYYAVGLDGERKVFVPAQTNFKGDKAVSHETFLSQAGYVTEVASYGPRKTQPLNLEDEAVFRLHLMESHRKAQIKSGCDFILR